MNGNSKNELEIVWRVNPTADFSWVDWNQDHIAYHRPSGTTHFLNLSSRVLLTEILQEPKDLVAIANALGADDSDSDLRDRIGELASLLNQLEHLGFIEKL